MWLAPSLRDRAVCEALPLCLDRLQAQSRNRQATITKSWRILFSPHVLSLGSIEDNSPVRTMILSVQIKSSL